MKLEHLKSGSWRIRQQVNGKRYSKNFDHKPTKKEMQIAMAEMMQNPSNTHEKGSLGQFIYKYVDLCRKNGKSPTTVDNYGSIARNLPEELMDMNLYDVDNKSLQKYFDQYGKSRSGKTVTNGYSLVRATLGEYRPEFTPSIKLPSKKPKAVYKPTTDDILAIVRRSDGTRYECAFHLALIGLRRGEIVAVTKESITPDNVLHITASMALGEDNQYHLKGPKTEAGNRSLPLKDQKILEWFQYHDKAFDGNPHTINETLHKYQDELGIPRFNLHMFRHFAAAYLHKQGYTDQQLLAWFGWTTPAPLIAAYNYNLDPTDVAEDISNTFGNLL